MCHLILYRHRSFYFRGQADARGADPALRRRAEGLRGGGALPPRGELIFIISMLLLLLVVVVLVVCLVCVYIHIYIYIYIYTHK